MSELLFKELHALQVRVSRDSDEGKIIHLLIKAVEEASVAADQARELAMETNALANRNWGSIENLRNHAPLKYGNLQPRGDNRHNDTWFETDDNDIIIGIHTFNEEERRWESKKFDKKSIIW